MNEEIQQTEESAELERVLMKTAVDAAFRSEFLSNPVGVLRSEGVDVSDEVKIQVIDAVPNRIVIPLPRFVGDELDGDQLEVIGGGLPSGVRNVLGNIALPFVLVSDRLSNRDALDSGTYKIQKWMDIG